MAPAAAAAAAADANEGAAEDVEVYANGVAFEVVKGWLGEEGKDLDFSAWYGAEDVNGDRASRPERLGLGAKFLPHKKAMQLMGGVQKKLGKSIMQSRYRRQEEEEEDDDEEEDFRGRAGRGGGGFSGNNKRQALHGAGGVRNGAGGGGGRGAKFSTRMDADGGADSGDSDSDEDGGGRAAAFAGKTAKRKSTSAPAWDPRTDAKCLQGNTPGQQSSKKKKKKKTK